MIVEILVTAVGIAMSAPALITEFSDSFQPSEWSTWSKLLPQIFLILAMTSRSAKRLIWCSLVLSVLGLLGTYFCLLFNSRASASVVCDQYSSVCADDAEASCSGIVIEPWEGLFYLIGLCFMTIGSTVLIRDNSLQIQERKIIPAE